VERAAQAAEETPPDDHLVIANLETLKLISDPLRLRIVDRLREASATVKELAAALDVPVRSLYYHVNLLEQHGLVRVVRTRIVSGILEKRYRATAYLFLFQDVHAGDGQGLQAMVTSVFRITDREIADALRGGLLSLDPAVSPADRLMMKWQLLSVTPARAAELALRLGELVKEYTPNPGGDHAAAQAPEPVGDETAGVCPEAGGATTEMAPGDGTPRPYRVLWTLFPVIRVVPGGPDGADTPSIPPRR
jgi:DNA-binding transcriptional ArsR family regulator